VGIKKVAVKRIRKEMEKQKKMTEGRKERLKLDNFKPERMLFPPGGVNLRLCLCGVPMHASAQTLDFIARRKNPRFPN